MDHAYVVQNLEGRFSPTRTRSASISYSFCMTYDNSTQQLLAGNCGNRIIEKHNRVYILWMDLVCIF